jgi:phosphohistidine phosphatase
MSNPPQRDTILQAGAIPFRRGERLTEFCLITSSSGDRWGFPKGIIESGDTAQRTALQEAYEEAGLHGRIIGDALGSYRYDKWGSELVVTMYLMEVDAADATWPEAEVRERAWLPAEEAADRLDRPTLKQLLAAAVEALA